MIPAVDHPRSRSPRRPGRAVSTGAALVVLLVAAACVRTAAPPAEAKTSPVDHVNPFIGTGGHGHTFPGATRPFGFVQLSPDTRLSGWDGCSGYHDSDRVIYGFSHTHLSGTGCSDYGDVLLAPTVGPVRYRNGAAGEPGYRSRFQKSTERAEPGYYTVKLMEPGVTVELTATPRAGFHCYTFPATREANLILDLVHRDAVRDARIQVVNDREVRGYRRSRGWAKDQIVYFHARFSPPFTASAIAVRDDEVDAKDVTHRHLKAAFRFTAGPDRPVLVKVGLSGVDLEGARKNLDREIPGWDFDAVRAEAREAWNRQLSVIDVEGGSEAQKTVFYTALYHACLAPNVYSDVDGRYRGRDQKIHTAEGYTHYTVFSLWDTFRAAHPLLTLLDPDRTTDFVRTMLAQYEQGGALPVWELSANETHCMIGYHAVPVIADAWVKGVRGFDGEAALRAMVASAESDGEGRAAYRRHGFIPAGEEAESVSRTLEYAFDDACIARMAGELGRTEIQRRFLARAQSWKNVLDPVTGFFRPRLHHAFVEPFDPAEVNHHYTEANAWQYAFFVPHDMEGLIRLSGGRLVFEKRLDDLFNASPRTTGRHQVDITGLIGQYAHGNEPSHHVAYLYAHVHRPWKTQQRVRQIMDTLYGAGPDGLSGNEDCGQLSAWLVWSALGFYPVTPGTPGYVLGTPLFPRAAVHLPGGRTFTVRGHGVSSTFPYIQRAALNGRALDRTWIDHDTLLRGGELMVETGPRPERAWATGPHAAPRSRPDGPLIVPLPYVARGDRIFQDRTEVEFRPVEEGDVVQVSVDGGRTFRPHESPIPLTETTTLYAYCARGGEESARIQVTFRKIPHRAKITLRTRYANPYAAGGDGALVDRERGGRSHRTGGWQGYQGVNLHAVVDLGEEQPLRRLAAGFLQERRAWIWMPLRVRFAVSGDGQTFTPVGEVTCGVDANAEGTIVKELSLDLPPATRARYVEMVAENRGTCPAGHPGAGRPAWIFADEIVWE